MIELKIEEYCQNCPSFEPESNSAVGHIESTYETGLTESFVHTTVTCKYRRRCAAMYRYLRGEVGKIRGEGDVRTGIQKETTKEAIKNEQN